MTDMLKHILENRYIKMYRLCSQNGSRERERGRETERQREMMQFIMMVLNVPFLEICHFILNPFLLLLSKDSEAIGECY